MKARTIREQVTDQIRDQVVSGGLAPGQPLRETEFAELYGVSRGPVRDAFLQLSQEGILTYQPNRGVTVRSRPNPDNRAFVVSLRRQIERFVVERGMDRVDERGFAELDARLADLGASCAAGDESAVALRDVAFHETLLSVCGGDDFLPVWKWLCSQMLMAYSRLENYEQVLREHEAILRALRDGSQSALIESLEANVR